MKKKALAVTIFIFILLGLVFAIFYYPAFPHNKAKATKIAEQYLADKYEQKMELKEIRVSWLVDPVLYHVYFSPVDNSELTFEVLLDTKFGLKDDAQSNLSADNYLFMVFETAVKEAVEPEVAKMWTETPSVLVIYNNGTYGFKIPEGLNENSTGKELQEKISHDVAIYSDRQFPADDEAGELQKIDNLIEALKEKECYFSKIEFVYSDKTIEIDNWKE